MISNQIGFGINWILLRPVKKNDKKYAKNEKKCRIRDPIIYRGSKFRGMIVVWNEILSFY